MRPNYSLKGFSLFVFTCLFVFNSNVFAQCGGIFFKSAAKSLLPPLSITDAADFTGDGKLDLLAPIADVHGLGNRIYVFPGNGDGTFGAAVENTFPYQFKPVYSRVADFNGDGKSDYFAYFEGNPWVIVYLSNGDGTFTQMTPTLLAAGEHFANIADVNGDGLLDLATLQNGGTGTRRIRFGNADGSFGNTILIPFNTETEGDFNNDGKLDFAGTAAGTPPLTLRINYNQGDGTFTPGDSLNLGMTGLLDTADFNNDGKLDIIGKTNYPTEANQTVSIIFNLGNNNFSKIDYPIEGFYDPVILGDFDGDNAMDFMTIPQRSSYIIFRNDGNGGFERREYNYKLFNPADSGVLLGDFNEDNKIDFLRVNNSRGTNVSLTPRLFDDTQINLLQGVCASPGQTEIVDFNHDLQSDRTLWRESDGRWRIGVASTTGDTAAVINWGTSGDLTAAGDYDGDGTSDVAVYRPSTGVWYIRNSSDGSHTTRQFGTVEDKPAAGDYNGDGRTDIAVFRPSEGTWYVLYSGTGEVFIRRFGSEGDVPVQEDYDGDGKIDLAVYRPSTNVWYYLKSSDGNYKSVLFGSQWDIPAPGDFDGDGKADFCVYHAPKGTWLILRSYNSRISEHRFGLLGDIPQIGDWNGDGIMDIGVYRPSTNIWYTAANVSLFGESSEVPISSILRIQ